MEHEKTVHQGKNVRRFREMLGMKQGNLAELLGKGWDQTKVSLLEKKDVIDKAILEDVAKALKIPAEAIENFDEDSAINIIANTFRDVYYRCTVNPIDELIGTYKSIIKEKNAEIKKLQKGKK